MSGHSLIRRWTVFDKDNNEVDWIDPYISHVQIHPGAYLVDNGYFNDYLSEVPVGGRFEITYVEDSDE